MIKAGGSTIRREIYELIISIWNKERMPKEWKESIIVPIYKKGDKTDCNNYNKMAVSHVCASAKALENLQKHNVLCNKVCQCCSVMKCDLQALENEVKSMSEVINILREELKYACTSKGDKSKPYPL